jgi:hypothetical protein
MFKTPAAAVVGAVAALLAGCSASTSSLSADLRDLTTHEPVAGATIRVHPMDPRHPFVVDDYLRAEPRNAQAVTDSSGHATLYVDASPALQIEVIGSGYRLDSVYLDFGETRRRSGEWLSPPDAADKPGFGREWEIRLTTDGRK